MTFIFTVVYIAISLLSPAVLPQALVSLHFAELIAVLMLLSSFTVFPDSRLGSTPLTYLAAGMIFFTLLSTAATGWIGALPNTLNLIVPPVYSFYFLALTCRNLFRIRVVVYMMTAVALFIFSQGYLAEAAGLLRSPYILVEHDVPRYMGLGFLSDPNDLAQLYVSLMPLLWIRWKKGAFLGNLLLTLLPCAILLFATYKTHSRGGIIALIALVLFVLKDKIGLILSSICTVLFGALTVALNMGGDRGLNEDDGGRVAAWITGLRVFLSHPFFGVGMGNFHNYNETGLTAHNSYVLCLAEIGIFGYFCWLGLLVVTWSGLGQMIGKRAAKAAPQDDNEGPLQGQPADMSMQAGTASHLISRSEDQGISAIHSPLTASDFPDAIHGWNPDGSVTMAASHFPAPENDSLFPDDKALLPPESSFRRYAVLFRLSFIGFMVTAFFLSRTYTMVLYSLLGLATALQLIYMRENPEFKLDAKFLAKKTVVVLFVSIILLYLFVRVRGV